MTLVHFVRHAQSISNAGLPTDHPSSIPLTEKGLEQARLTSLAFPTQPDLIVTSPFLRTQTSAQPLKTRHPLAPQAEWPVQEFTNLNPAHWNGTTVDQRAPLAHAYWDRNDPAHRDGDGAESFDDLMQRIEQLRQLICAQGDVEIVLFSHGLFTRAFWWRMLMQNQPINPDNMRHCLLFMRGLPLPNCAIVDFRFENDQIWISGPRSAHLPNQLITY